MVSGLPSSLLSSFRLSYYTLLNLLRRVEGSEYDMEFVIAHSFQQFQFDQKLPRVRLASPATTEAEPPSPRHL